MGWSSTVRASSSDGAARAEALGVLPWCSGRIREKRDGRRRREEGGGGTLGGGEEGRGAPDIGEGGDVAMCTRSARGGAHVLRGKSRGKEEDAD